MSLDAAAIAKFKVAELKAELVARGLDNKGKQRPSDVRRCAVKQVSTRALQHGRIGGLQPRESRRRVGDAKHLLDEGVGAAIRRTVASNTVHHRTVREPGPALDRRNLRPLSSRQAERASIGQAYV